MCHVRAQSWTSASHLATLNLGFQSVEWDHNASLRDLRPILFVTCLVQQSIKCFKHINSWSNYILGETPTHKIALLEAEVEGP